MITEDIAGSSMSRGQTNCPDVAQRFRPAQRGRVNGPSTARNAPDRQSRDRATRDRSHTESALGDQPVTAHDDVVGRIPALAFEAPRVGR